MSLELELTLSVSLRRRFGELSFAGVVFAPPLVDGESISGWVRRDPSNHRKLWLRFPAITSQGQKLQFTAHLPSLACRSLREFSSISGCIDDGARQPLAQFELRFDFRRDFRTWLETLEFVSLSDASPVASTGGATPKQQQEQAPTKKRGKSGVSGVCRSKGAP